ncbi:MAG: tyrosine-type recombinase/integrase [Clostridia bacterium]|nr:tyrosine-type recombinase/integrase [Clostridia bacterium]
MLEEARCQKLNDRISKLLEKYNISENFSYSTQEKDGVYQCVIKYQVEKTWKSLWVSTGYKAEKGNLRKAKKTAEDIASIFKQKITTKNEEKQNKQKQNINFLDFQRLVELNTTNYDPNKTTRADWDFYEYMEYWLYKIIKHSVERDTFDGYEKIVTRRTRNYFTMKEHKKAVKEITANDLDDFYNYLRESGLKNATIDHYNDNISSAFNFLLKKKEVRFNPTEMIEPIVVEIKEVPTYTREEIKILFDILKNDPIRLPTIFDGYYGLRRSEIIGLRIDVFDFENNNFVINHVAIQCNGNQYKEKVYFKDKTKSKKGCRVFPLFEDVKEAVLEKIQRIEQCKKVFGNSYNHKYDGYLCVHDNGDLIQPNYFTKRFKKIIDRNGLKKITPHGLRHSIATLLHLENVDVRDLQDWLGHESITSTNRYTRSDYKKQVTTRKCCL